MFVKFLKFDQVNYLSTIISTFDKVNIFPIGQCLSGQQPSKFQRNGYLLVIVEKYFILLIALQIVKHYWGLFFKIIIIESFVRKHVT